MQFIFDAITTVFYVMMILKIISFMEVAISRLTEVRDSLKKME